MIKIMFGFLAGVGLIGLAWWHDVPTDATAEDRMAVRQIMAPSYQDEIDLIRHVQQRVFDASPVYRSIPTGQSREPADLILAGQGLCFDRSRSIEKALAALGFDTRHVAVYGSAKAAVMPGIESHALSEVRTSRGWMLVDSVTPWLGLDADGAPISADMLSATGAAAIAWHAPIPEMIGILAGDFVHVFGLFSRHGQFYPPFTPFPDVSWWQLVQNLWAYEPT